MTRQTMCYILLGLVVSFSGTVSSTWSEGLPGGRENNWHQFRGPNSTGVAPNGNPPTTWDAETNVKWKVAIPGRGSASPIVWGNRVYVLTAVKTDRTADTSDITAQSTRQTPARLVSDLVAQAEGNQAEQSAEQAPPEGERRGQNREGRGRGRRGGRGGFGRGEPPTNVHEFVVLCLDRNTGETLWQQTACEAVPHQGHHRTSSFASASPITDGRNLYISFGSRGIYSYDMDGNFRWKKDLGPMRTKLSFGEGTSPALYGDTLVINWDQEDQSFITALDANTGDTKWKVDRDEETTWSTPLIIDHNGRTQVIVNGTNRTRSYDLDTGEIIWECGGQAQGVIPTPIVYGDLVLCMTGHRGAALKAIPLDSTGDITDTDQIVWTRDEGLPYVPSPLLYDDLLYFTKSNNAILTCVSAETGEVHFENKRLEGLDSLYASSVGARNRIYISGREGTTLVLKKGTELEILAANDIGETIDATPAIAGNQMFIRGENHLFCISED